MWLYGQKPIKASYHPAKFGGIIEGHTCFFTLRLPILELSIEIKEKQKAQTLSFRNSNLFFLLKTSQISMLTFTITNGNFKEYYYVLYLKYFYINIDMSKLLSAK